MLDALTLAEPLVENLLQLERGVQMYDAMLEQIVVVMAPVMFVMADNPMSSELCNHQGSSARKFCRMCLVLSHQIMHMAMITMYFVQVDKTADPDGVGDLRTKYQTSKIMSIVDKESSIKDKHAISTRYGLYFHYNPLFKLSVDLHR